jgi:hypothetical protein
VTGEARSRPPASPGVATDGPVRPADPSCREEEALAMTRAEEAQFIALWQQGAAYRELAAAFGCPLGTVSSQAATLVAQGKIQPRPRGGAYPSRRAQAGQRTHPRPPRHPRHPPHPHHR